MERQEVESFNFSVADYATKLGLAITLFVGTDFQEKLIKSEAFEKQLANDDCDDQVIMELDVGLKKLHKKILGDFIKTDKKTKYDNKTLRGEVHDS